MRPPPPTKCLRYPITTCIIVLASAATFQSWFVGNYIDPAFLSNTGNCLREPWRLLTPTFFHGGPLHSIFNVCWLWAFGTVVESRFGHAATLGICLLLGVGSVSAELALFRCGLGLSGVVYGLFGLLWVLSRNDPRFEDVVDERIVELMIGWFILCIVLKVADVWNIALVSHAAGCILGALLGWTITADRLSHRLGRSTSWPSRFFSVWQEQPLPVRRSILSTTSDPCELKTAGWRGHAAIPTGPSSPIMRPQRPIPTCIPGGPAWDLLMTRLGERTRPTTPTITLPR